MPCCHDNHNTELAMQRRAAFSWAGQKAMRSLRSSSLRSRDALHLSSKYTYYLGLYVRACCVPCMATASVGETKVEEPLAAARTEEAMGEGGKVEVGESQGLQNREES